MNIKTWSFLFFMVVLISPDAGITQNPELDSLAQLAANSKDTIRIDALIQLGKRLRLNDLESSIQVLATARDEAAQAGYSIRHIRAITSIGISYGMQEDYVNAMEQFKLGLGINTQHGYLLGMAESYNNLGIVYKYIGDYSGSQEAYIKAMALYDTLDNQSGRAACFHNIGVVTDMMGETEKAMDYFQKALKIQEALGEEVDRSLVLHSIGLAYEELGKYPEALENLFAALEIHQKLGDQITEANTLCTIGKLYLSMGAYELAAKYLHQSQEKSITLGLKTPYINTLHNLAKLYLIQKEAFRAIPLLEEHIRLANELGSHTLQKQGYALMAEAQAVNHNYKLAYEHALLTQQFTDSLFNSEKTQAFQQSQARLGAYEKDRQLQEQQKDLQWLQARSLLDRQLRWALIIALILAGFSAVLFYQKYKLRQQTNQLLHVKNERIEAQKIEIEQVNLELEKRMLRAQINPHFIFNSLGSIQHFITANDRASALKYLSKFSNLLRQVLEESVTNQVILVEEIKLLQTYLDLESLRFDHSFSYEIETASDLDIYTTEVPILLIQPFVENAILHGLMPKVGERKLQIYFYNEEGNTCCKIRDNGIGRTAAAALKAQKIGHQTSRGMEVTQKRLHALNKNSDAQTLVVINDLYDNDGIACGTEVIIHISKL